MNNQPNSKIKNFSKKLYEIESQLGPLSVQTMRFSGYFIIIISHRQIIQIDGTIQLSFPTPFEKELSVLDINAYQNQSQSQYIPKMLGKEFNKPVLFLNNLRQKLTFNGEKLVTEALIKILKYQIALDAQSDSEFKFKYNQYQTQSNQAKKNEACQQKMIQKKSIKKEEEKKQEKQKKQEKEQQDKEKRQKLQDSKSLQKEKS